MRCVDDSAWNNLHGKACLDYSAYCEAGSFRLGASWAGGEVFNWPERNCCACGKPAAEQAPEKPQLLFETHPKSFCRGADHEVKLKDGAACVDHCHPSKRPCACFHFAHGECHFTFNYAGLATSTKSSTAWVSSTALLASSKTAAASSAGGASCAPVPVLRTPPSFFMYNDAPFAWGPRLAACFASRQGVPPWAMAVNDSAHQLDGTAQPGLAYSLWLSAALAGHRRRVATPEQARARRVCAPCAGPRPCTLRPATKSPMRPTTSPLLPLASAPTPHYSPGAPLHRARLRISLRGGGRLRGYHPHAAAGGGGGGAAHVAVVRQVAATVRASPPTRPPQPHLLSLTLLSLALILLSLAPKLRRWLSPRPRRLLHLTPSHSITPSPSLPGTSYSPRVTPPMTTTRLERSARSRPRPAW